MLVIGLTGGIGSGKTTVSNLFAKKNIPILDADIIAREITAPGMVAYLKIIKHFKQNILLKHGALNRTKLRKIIFQDAKERIWLEKLLHPIIRKSLKKKLRGLSSSHPYCLLVIPLLVESKSFPLIDRILVVDLKRANQIQRIQKRDKISKEEVLAIIKTQAKRRHRLAKADDVIINDGVMSDLAKQVEKLHRKYLRFAEKNSTF